MAEERVREDGGPNDRLRGRGVAPPEPASDFGVEPDEAVEHAMGESFSMEERLVVAPAGRLRLRRAPPISEGEFVAEGETLAEVLTPSGETLVIGSPCDGRVMGFLLHDGFPVRAMEPVLWLRPSDQPIARAAVYLKGTGDRQTVPGNAKRAGAAISGSLSSIEAWFTPENGGRPESSELCA